MTTVTRRLKQIKQPRGGYIPPKSLRVTEYDDGNSLHDVENIHSSLVGMAVDYLIRFANGSNPKEAFRISLMGAELAGESKLANKLVSGVKGLDDSSISNACKLVGFDVCYRVGMMGYKPVQTINPDVETINNIRTMVNRGLSFMERHAPIVADGFTFEGGYTSEVTSGDGDILTSDGLWDFKVSVNNPTKDHTLQLLMYYLLGLRSIHPEFEHVQKLGIFNPRLNKEYTIYISDLDSDVLLSVSRDVLGVSI